MMMIPRIPFATARSRLRLRSRRFLPMALVCASIALPLPGRGAGAASGVTLHWLDGHAPNVSEDVSWGVPWARGELSKEASANLVLRTADGGTVPMQTWPLAYWPDGSVKWSGHAIAAGPELSGSLTLEPGEASAPANALRVTEDDGTIVIDTGALQARIPDRGAALIESLRVGDREIGRNARLIARLEDRSQQDQGITRTIPFTSRVEKVTLEQRGPVRAVVRIEGKHAADGGGRTWLPFVVRLYFTAGSDCIRLVHTILFDGDAEKDFISGVGLAFTVPLQEELQNRHVRFVGDGSGVWTQPIRLMPGYRPSAGPAVTENYADHLAGRRMPNLDELDERARTAVQSVAVYDRFRLTQLGPDGYSIDKRTNDRSSWLHVTNGRRSLGLGVLADVSGGLAIGLKDFWQKYPSSIEISGATTNAGEIRVWIWSPQAAAMDLRHYDTIPHGLRINYEDWKPGWSTPYGVANTSELVVRAFSAIPSDAELAQLARAVSAPARLVCAPEYYHRLHAFGYWSLPDRSTPTRRWIEDQIAGLVNFYRDQVDERSWYGFWNFGDIMHNYDFGRHEWRYDIGGWAWVNTELMPDMLLWFTFLRTGRADIFRMAEAMTRHTSEVDVYHFGPFAPLGSRHNVVHWGDGAKQPRMSHAGLKRFYYYLTTDERVGDLLHEQLDADLTYDVVRPFNGSHYVPTPDGGYRLENPNSRPAPRPEDFGPRPTTRETATELRLEWMCYALNWATEWERTGDTRWRDRVLADMHGMAGAAESGRLAGRYFDMIFGGPENMAMLEPMFDVPEFWSAWANTCEAIGRRVGGNQMTGPRMLAYAARVKNDAELGRLAWEKLIGDALDHGIPEVRMSTLVDSPVVVHPVHDPNFLGDSVGWQLHGPASVQWALNAIETLELAKPWLPDWEKSHGRSVP